MYSKKIITGMFILLFTVCLGQAGQNQPSGLSLLEPLLNKTWVGMLKSPDRSSEFEVTRRFEAVWDGSVIKYSKNNRALNNSGEGYIYWDDAAKKAAFFFIESSGTFLNGYVSADHNLITFEGKMTWPRTNPNGKQVYDFRNTFEITSESEMVDKWFHNAFGPWRPGHTIVFKAEETTSRSSLPEDVYSGFFIIDGHTHDLVTRNNEEPAQAGLDRLAAAGIDGVVQSFPLNRTEPEKVIEQIAVDRETIKRYAAENNVQIEFIDKFYVPDKGRSGGPLQILSSIEYFDGLFDMDLDRIEQLNAAGIAAVTLVDNDKDRLSENKNGRAALNDFGRKVVRKMNDLGIVIDITHLSESLRLDVIRCSWRPVMASHSNARGVAAVARNLSDEVMSELTNRGGIVFLTFDKEYLFGRESAGEADGILKLVEHIDYIVDHCGIAHAGIGTDYGGSGGNAPSDLLEIECFKSIAEALIGSGYTREQTAKIMGGNLIEFFSAAHKKSI